MMAAHFLLPVYVRDRIAAIKAMVQLTKGQRNDMINAIVEEYRKLCKAS